MAEIVDHKDRLREYFDGQGFERWRAIYGDGELSGVRRTIRAGHTRMLALADAWLAESFPDGQLASRPVTLLDAGCGTGLFALAQAQRGFAVTAVDIAPQMIQAAAERARELGVAERVALHSGDVEHLRGVFDAVACFDVLIHYQAASFAQLLAALARRSTGPLLFTYAPYEPLLGALHWIGGRFPRADRRTDIQLAPERVVRTALASAGMQLIRSQPIRSGFYHVNLVEARPRSAG